MGQKGYLSFRNLKRPKLVKDGQTADYQLVLRFFRVLSHRIQDRFQTKKRPFQTEFWH